MPYKEKEKMQGDQQSNDRRPTITMMERANSSRSSSSSECGTDTHTDLNPLYKQNLGDGQQVVEKNVTLGLGAVNVELINGVVQKWHTDQASHAWLTSIEKTTSVQKLFNSDALQKLADVKQRIVEVGAFSDVDEDEKLVERKVVAVVLAFQRWRHTQLKNIFSQELKKLLEEAREDEATLEALETQFRTSQENLALAIAETTQLRIRLAALETGNNHCDESLYPEGGNVGYTCIAPNMLDVVDQVKENDKRMMRAMEELATAEDEVQRRGTEIRQLKERLKRVEEKSGHIDGQLQASIGLLQAEKNGALEENRVLLEQLARRDEDVQMQGEEMERLKAIVARLAERQSVDQQHMDSLKTEHVAEILSLQKQLRQAYGAKCSKETELASYTERCNGLGQERESLMLQLQHAVERANVASCRAEELQTKLQCTAEDRAKASEEVASEMTKHLKRLTDHMQELETPMSTTEQHISCHQNGLVSVRSKGMDNTPGIKLESEEPTYSNSATSDPDHVPYDLAQNSDPEVFGDCPKCAAKIGNGHESAYNFSARLEQRAFITTTGEHLHLEHRDLNNIRKWITWKWRWAASSARAELLAKHVHGVEQNKYEDLKQIHKSSKAEDTMPRLRLRNLTTCMGKEISFMLPEHRLLPLILSAWRAFARTCVLERKAISRSASLNKMMEALPWWIQRVGERRNLERTFFHWQLLTLRANRQQPKTSCNKQYKEKERPPLPSTMVSEPKRHVDQKGPRAAGRVAVIPPRKSNWGHATTVPVNSVLGEKRISSASVTQLPEINYDPKPNNGTACSSRALKDMQSSLQHEVTELQKMLTHEIQALQHQGNSRPVLEPPIVSFTDHQGPNRKRSLRSILEVCNNLGASLTEVRRKLCPESLKNNKVELTHTNRDNRTKQTRELPGRFLEIPKGQSYTRSPKRSPRRLPLHVHVSPVRQIRPRVLRHHYPWLGGGIRMVSRNQTKRHLSPPSLAGTNLDQGEEERIQYSMLDGHGMDRKSSPLSMREKMHLASIQEIRSPRRAQATSRRQSSQSVRPSSWSELCSMHKPQDQVQKPPKSAVPKASVRTNDKECHPRSGIVVEITPDGNNCNEVTIRTEPAQEMEQMHAPSEDTITTRTASVATMHPNEKLVEDRAALACLKKKCCIGTAYANLLSAEIFRLRQGRENVSHQILEDRVKSSNF